MRHTIAVIVLAFALVYFAVDNFKLKTAYERYAISNGHNIGKERIKACKNLYSNISFDTGVPTEFLQSGGIAENVGNLFEFGVKLVPQFILKGYPVDEWQPRAAARIYTQEAFKFILSDPVRFAEYCGRLGQRYCSHNKKYGDTLKIVYNNLTVPK
jgi:hypothetical protein